MDLITPVWSQMIVRSFAAWACSDSRLFVMVPFHPILVPAITRSFDSSSISSARDFSISRRRLRSRSRSSWTAPNSQQIEIEKFPLVSRSTQRSANWARAVLSSFDCSSMCSVIFTWTALTAGKMRRQIKLKCIITFSSFPCKFCEHFLVCVAMHFNCLDRTWNMLAFGLFPLKAIR